MEQFQIGRWYLRWTTIPKFWGRSHETMMISDHFGETNHHNFGEISPNYIMIPPIHDLPIPTINLSFAIESWGPINH